MPKQFKTACHVHPADTTTKTNTRQDNRHNQASMTTTTTRTMTTTTTSTRTADRDTQGTTERGAGRKAPSKSVPTCAGSTWYHND